MQSRPIVHSIALTFVALGVLRAEPSCGQPDSFPAASDAGVKKSKKVWNQPAYFDIRHHAPPNASREGKSNERPGFEAESNMGSTLIYGDWRVVAGWESVPATAGTPFTTRRRHGMEIGYVFSRALELSGSPDLSLSNAVTLGITTRF